MADSEHLQSLIPQRLLPRNTLKASSVRKLEQLRAGDEVEGLSQNDPETEKCTVCINDVYNKCVTYLKGTDKIVKTYEEILILLDPPATTAQEASVNVTP